MSSVGRWNPQRSAFMVPRLPSCGCHKHVVHRKWWNHWTALHAGKLLFVLWRLLTLQKIAINSVLCWVYLLTKFYIFLLAWISSMHRLPWHLLAISGCCATLLFWKMVVLWYVICITHECFDAVVNFCAVVSFPVLPWPLWLWFCERFVKDHWTTLRMVRACHRCRISLEQRCSQVGISYGLVKVVDRSFM